MMMFCHWKERGTEDHSRRDVTSLGSRRTSWRQDHQKSGYVHQVDTGVNLGGDRVHVEPRRKQHDRMGYERGPQSPERQDCQASLEKLGVRIHKSPLQAMPRSQFFIIKAMGAIH